MRAVVQRVLHAAVAIDGNTRGQIARGAVVLLGIAVDDTSADVEWLSGKISRLRIFDDENGVMNRSIQEVNGNVLLISQFTLFASTQKGNRPSYSRSARPEVASPLYEEFIRALEQNLGRGIQRGEFGAHMLVSLTNDGPVTIVLDTRARE
jgi:D-tyrosyl-tRNA(Tyr) deacylase